ncbi:farnesyl diphosphate synthase [Streptococcus pneumoniae]|nr:farnesyl diphosphate synthase [Streptococcus pneumoniae]
MKKQEKLALVESALEDFYGDQQFASSLRESVLYSIHAGGKRIRPFLLTNHKKFGEAMAILAGGLDLLFKSEMMYWM